MKRILVFLLVLTVLLSACVPPAAPPTPPEPVEVAPPVVEVQENASAQLPEDPGAVRDPRCPQTCGDGNSCTQDVCNLQTEFECRHVPIHPCCGNGVCESTENSISCTADCAGSSPVYDELVKNSGRVESLQYHFESYEGDVLSDVYDVKTSGPLTLLIFEKLFAEKDGFSYGKVLINKSGDYATLFCYPECSNLKTPARITKDYERFKQVLPLDILHSLSNVTVIGEENIEGKAGTVLEEKLADGGTRRVKVWTFYGVPMLVERFDENGVLVAKVRFRTMTVNSLKQSDLLVPANAEYQ